MWDVGEYRKKPTSPELMAILKNDPDMKRFPILFI
jgi:hypothetical protein